jgi:hypothetical protein
MDNASHGNSRTYGGVPAENFHGGFEIQHVPIEFGNKSLEQPFSSFIRSGLRG